jgi:hypothetical protein
MLMGVRNIGSSRWNMIQSCSSERTSLTGVVAVAADDQGKLPNGMLIGPAFWFPAEKLFFTSFRYSGSEITVFI